MLSTIIISAILVVMVFFALRHVIKSVKAGKCIGCSGCKNYGKEGKCSGCRSYEKENVKDSMKDESLK